MIIIIENKLISNRAIGTRLTGARNVYQLDMDPKDSKPKRQLEATPVTLYNSSGDYLPGALIASNHNYVSLLFFLIYTSSIDE